MHAEMVRICLGYLEMVWRKSGSETACNNDDLSLLQYPFLEYAINYWRWHYSEAYSRDSDDGSFDTFSGISSEEIGDAIPEDSGDLCSKETDNACSEGPGEPHLEGPNEACGE